MSTEIMNYDPRVKDLEEKVSYGTLGILDRLARASDDNPGIKKNLLLINGATIVRNCYYRPDSNSDKHVLDAVAFDFEQLRHYFEMYTNQPATMLVYFHVGVNKLIPESARKRETNNRLNVERLTAMVATSEGLRPNTITKLSSNNNITYCGLVVSGTFAYRILNKSLHELSKTSIPKIWMVSSCPIDYFLFDTFPQLEIIDSHTGKIVLKKDLPEKIFGDPAIPFNRITYKLFGDKNLVKAACRNRPKAIALLDGALKLRTEREIAALAKTRLGIDSKSINWDL